MPVYVAGLERGSLWGLVYSCDLSRLSRPKIFVWKRIPNGLVRWFEGQDKGLIDKRTFT